MKIATLSIQKFIAAVIIAVALSFAFAPSPSPVSTPVIEVTPVPTPAPVYITIEPTPHIEPQPTTMTMEENITVGMTELTDIMLMMWFNPFFLFIIGLPVLIYMFRFAAELTHQE